MSWLQLRLCACAAVALQAGLTPLRAQLAPPVRGVVEELTQRQRSTVDSGGEVQLTRVVAGSAWPAVRIYLYIDASPEESAAVFADYDRHANYFPDVKRSHVSRVIDGVTKEVDYVLSVPFWSDERYTVRDRLRADSAGRYAVEWSLVRASSIRAVTGSARFEPYRSERIGRSGTLMAYDNEVIPGSRLASIGFIRGRAITQVGVTARAFARQVEKERTGESSRLSRQVAAVRAALSP